MSSRSREGIPTTASVAQLWTSRSRARGEAIDDLVDQVAQRLLVQGCVPKQQPQVQGSIDAVEHQLWIYVRADFTACHGTVDEFQSGCAARQLPLIPKGCSEVDIALSLTEQGHDQTAQVRVTQYEDQR